MRDRIGLRSGRFRMVAAIALALLVGGFALSGVTDAAEKTLSFGDAPTDWSITSGEADARIGKVTASGIKEDRIRYSLSGANGFSIRPKLGVVGYDGSEIAAGQVQLTATARDSKGKAESASVTITVSVTQPEPAAQLSFGDAPTDWSITSAEAQSEVGKFLATGVKKNRIRYALVAPDGFSVKAKQGVVAYDGTAIAGEQALISLTATDRKGKAESASVTISVSVSQPESETIPQRERVTLEPESSPHTVNSPAVHPGPFHIVAQKLQQVWDRGCTRNQGCMELVGASLSIPMNYPNLYESFAKWGGARNSVTYARAFIGKGLDRVRESDAKWTLDAHSVRLGFHLARMDGTRYVVPATLAYSDEDWHAESTISVGYNGRMGVPSGHAVVLTAYDGHGNANGGLGNMASLRIPLNVYQYEPCCGP